VDHEEVDPAEDHQGGLEVVVLVGGRQAVLQVVHSAYHQEEGRREADLK